MLTVIRSDVAVMARHVNRRSREHARQDGRVLQSPRIRSNYPTLMSELYKVHHDNVKFSGHNKC